MTWLCCWTKPQSEEIAAEHLLRQSYTPYLPMFTSRSGARKPLFPRYLFVSVADDQPRRPICSTRGVAGLVMRGGMPASLPEAVVAELRAREQEGAFVEMAIRQLPIGSQIKVTAGPFQAFVGRLIGRPAADRVYVLLEFMGRQTRAEVMANEVEAA